MKHTEMRLFLDRAGVDAASEQMACWLAELGVREQALGIAGALGLILDFIVTGFGLGMRHMELVLQAENLGMLDRDVLRRQ